MQKRPRISPRPLPDRNDLAFDLFLDDGRAVAALLDHHGLLHPAVAVMPAFMPAIVVMHADFAVHSMLAPFVMAITAADADIHVSLRELDAIRRGAGGKSRCRECEGGRRGHRESKGLHIQSSLVGRRAGPQLSFAPVTQEGSGRSAEISLSY